MRFIRSAVGTAALLALCVAARPAQAQTQTPPPPEAARITLEEATKAMDAAEAEARRNNWTLAIVISDAEGTPIYMRRMDGARKRFHDIAMSKIRTVIAAGMHTADYGAAVKAGKPAIEGGITFDGGFLLKRNGQIVGAFSASGARADQDGQVVKAGMAAIGIQP